VPVGLVDEIRATTGAVWRTAWRRGGARCDSEAANTITLNLVHEIVARSAPWRRRARSTRRTWPAAP
jgi:hypothetical protein